ncbi:MAG: M48 family metalloprotease [Alphaproteobacteria bacterium]
MTPLTRRGFVHGCGWCTALALLSACQSPQGREGAVAPGYRPAPDSDEGGLWEIMDREEARLRQSRFLVRDPAVTAYVHDIACRLADDRCRDLRLYVIRTPYFNAMMAPNGMMQIWSGLLLRTSNEAQLAAVIGHEFGHYRQRHTLDRLRDVRSKADVGAFLGLGFAAAGLGAVGNLAQLALIASIFAYNRDQEREADDIGIDLMAKAGFAPLEASHIWEQIVAEEAADPYRGARDPFFASHPAPEERMATMREAAAKLEAPNQGTYADRYRTTLRGFRASLLQDEIRLRQYARSLVLMDRLIEAAPKDGELLFYRGEVYRLRDHENDRDRALANYDEASAGEGAPPEIWRSRGLVHRTAGDRSTAATAFDRYLTLRPDAPDRDLLRTYMVEGSRP